MILRRLLPTATLGAALVIGGFVTPAQATQSGADDARVTSPRAATAENAPAAQWYYSQEKFLFRDLCDARGRQFGLPWQCRGPHTDGYYHLWYYF